MTRQPDGSSRSRRIGICSSSVCYLTSSNIPFGIRKDQLTVRTKPEKAEETLNKKNTESFYIKDKPMKGWFVVPKEGYRGSLQERFGIDIDFVSSLTPKEKK